MNDDLGITVDDLVASLKARRIRIPSEIGAFVALETSEALLRGPAAVEGRDVRIADDGTISVLVPPHSSSEAEAAQSVVRILSSLLVAAGTGVPPALIALVEHGAGSSESALDSLRAELEVSLVPLNRAAARRVLSRMTREARRGEGTFGGDTEPLPQEHLDEALDDLLATDARPSERPSQTRNLTRSPVKILPAEEFDHPPRSQGASTWLLAFVIIGLSAAAAIALVRTRFWSSVMGRTAPETAQQDDVRLGTLNIRTTPDEAQVLMFVGRGPAIARQLPTGMAYELVAIAEGRAPSRAVVPADASWESTFDGPRYELAMQVSEEPMPVDALVLGATRLLPDQLGVPSDELGTIRVVTNPPGAKVYLLVGFTPNATVSNLRIDEPIEFLVFREGYVLERMTVAPNDWTVDERGRSVAAIDVELRRTLE